MFESNALGKEVVEAEESDEGKRVQILTPALAWIEGRPVPTACAEQSSTQRVAYTVRTNSQTNKRRRTCLPKS